MTYYYDELVRSRRRAFAAGVVAGALVIALIWVTLWAVGSSGLEEPAPPGPTGDALDTQPLIPETAQNRLTRCEEVFAAQTPLLETLPRPLSQWRTQISRTNKLVTGVITPRGGHGESGVKHGRCSAHCRATGRPMRSTTSGRHVAPHLTRGRRGRSRSNAAQVLLRATHRSLPQIPRWAVGSNMSMTWSCLRRARSPSRRPSRRWLTSWREGVKELEAYTAAASAADGQVC